MTPPAVYRRARSKDALFLAVFEHAMEQVRATERAVVARAPEPGGPAEAVVRHAVEVVTTVFTAHQDLLRAVVVVSAANEVVRRHGVEASASLGDLFARLTDDVVPAERRPLRTGFFQAMFGAHVLRTGFGTGFAEPEPLDDQAYADRLAELAVAVLVP